MDKCLIGTVAGPADLFDLQVPDVNVWDICRTLSNLCRFGGRGSRFYSVAQHSIAVLEIAKAIDPDDPATALGGLTHDFAEAFIGDVIQPIKSSLPNFTSLEKVVEQRLSELLTMGHFKSPIVKLADMIACYHEATSLSLDPHWWGFPTDVTDYALPASAGSVIHADLGARASHLLLWDRYLKAMAEVAGD